MKTGWVSQIKQSKPVKKIQKKVLDLCIAGTNLRQRALCKYLLKAHSVTQMKDCSNLGTASTRANSGVGEPCSCPRACLWQRVLLCIFHGAHSPRESLVGKWRSLVGKWRYASCSALCMGPAWCALTPAAAGVRPRLLLLHRERRQYCSSAKFDFAGAGSHLKNPKVIFKIVASHARKQRWSQALYILMT